MAVHEEQASIPRGSRTVRIDPSASRVRHNTTAGVYGAQASVWLPILLFGLVLAAYLWRRGAMWQWPELAWFSAAVVQMLIRWPHVQRNRANRIAERRVGVSEQWSMLVLFLTLLCVPMVGLATPWLQPFDYSLADEWSLCGVALMCLSLWMFHRTHAELGRNWSPSLEVRHEHRLVTAGIYARIRHPMYGSVWLFAIAQPMLMHNWVAGALAVPGFALLYFLRVRAEEQLMLDTFGDDYRAYMARTGRLWPRFKA